MSRMATKAVTRSARRADEGEPHSLADKHGRQRLPLSAERHANADLAGALRNGIRDDP